MILQHHNTQNNQNDKSNIIRRILLNYGLWLFTRKKEPTPSGMSPLKESDSFYFISLSAP